MKNRIPIIILSTVVAFFIFVFLYEVLAPILNTAKECRSTRSGGGFALPSSTPCSIIGYELKRYWFISRDLMIPMSIPFALFFSSLTALILLIKTK